MRLTEQDALGLEATFGGAYVGHRLEFAEVTVYGDESRMFLLLTARCDYSGSVNPHAKCRACGAGPRDGRYETDEGHTRWA